MVKKEHLLAEEKIEKSKLIKSLLFPVFFVLFVWLVKLFEIYFEISLVHYGLFPQNFTGLRGIIFMPLIHGSFEHLGNNTIPILVLGTAIFYFYREVAYKIIVLSWILGGLWLWFTSPGVYHIGASGLIYAWASFLFFSGVIRTNKNLLAISLLVIFLYGSMVWGLFPIKEGISWEGHLMGSLAGGLLAYYYKDYGPRKKIPEWMEEKEDEDEDDIDYSWIEDGEWKQDNQNNEGYK